MSFFFFFKKCVLVCADGCSQYVSALRPPSRTKIKNRSDVTADGPVTRRRRVCSLTHDRCVPPQRYELQCRSLQNLPTSSWTEEEEMRRRGVTGAEPRWSYSDLDPDVHDWKQVRNVVFK